MTSEKTWSAYGACKVVDWSRVYGSAIAEQRPTSVTPPPALPLPPPRPVAKGAPSYVPSPLTSTSLSTSTTPSSSPAVSSAPASTPGPKRSFYDITINTLGNILGNLIAGWCIWLFASGHLSWFLQHPYCSVAICLGVITIGAGRCTAIVRTARVRSGGVFAGLVALMSLMAIGVGGAAQAGWFSWLSWFPEHPWPSVAITLGVIAGGAGWYAKAATTDRVARFRAHRVSKYAFQQLMFIGVVGAARAGWLPWLSSWIPHEYRLLYPWLSWFPEHPWRSAAIGLGAIIAEAAAGARTLQRLDQYQHYGLASSY
jgi:hypothetical protein